ncbi:OPT oligopeptide transporter protein-domain-containing protein [Boletus reticuloceps]|uniref:OPT oligopeptide transporter protein-domain-containing protein n=1 Tax=Boletus reticuloceps TaxID=495285 RepID=A0A8I3A5C8_9AGAM|nr:OPT oligopeptide transporter protein-domain-containing protein [Boletus reticuloceps]
MTCAGRGAGCLPLTFASSGKNLRGTTVKWKFWNDDGMREQPMANEDIDPHYAQMLKVNLGLSYPDAPNSWYYATFMVSFVVALVVIYKNDSTLPWWGFVIAVVLATISILFLGALSAITGVTLSIHDCRILASWKAYGQHVLCIVTIRFHRPFCCSVILRSANIGLPGNTAINKDLYVMKDTKLPPRAAFTAQIIGTLLGAILNYFSVQGTNIWSGQQPQAYNSQAIAGGGLSHELFSVGMRYQWVPLSYLVGLAAPVPFWLVHRYWPKLLSAWGYQLLSQVVGWLGGGINSMVLSYFMITFASQWWIRTRYPSWFQKYNYLVGTGVFLFRVCVRRPPYTVWQLSTVVPKSWFSFAVEGAAGTSHLFPA